MQEFLATLALVLGVLLIDARGEEVTGEFALLWGPLKAFFIGLYAVVLILALGGPTGGLRKISCMLTSSQWCCRVIHEGRRSLACLLCCGAQ